ncbi:50S ribosomal protein L11 methyltransferase [Sphingobacterium sp. SRCM116780]|uniref:50S ribosomal protein L11 methyltransferase n=1 Tax=Sphingobacterium sp. SRCM116780 TaxID=2907623 RepID=UPI001F1F9D19|nr:50S ribosomal protein L11 methyltransferase [Sphingobacterium sp. SRCM116780]UIR56734.1 50S ribosomal protein L11 methyltransferase [Sphingobacterium sp. SRCM116780]
MKYSKVIFTRIAGEEWQQDLFIAELADIGFDTFEDIESGFAAFVPTANLDIQALETKLLQQEDGFEVNYEVVDIEDQNWNKLWESNFNPILVGDQCYVRATFHPARPEIQYEIVIDPKMSFGTGHHQTTTMMIQYILENEFQDKEVLDMGCGTGILAILAAQKNAKHILAVDFDDVCIASVEENKILNNLTNIESKLGSFETIVGREFDTILANINRNILIEHFPQYSKSLRLKGELYISGFLVGQDIKILTARARALGFEPISNKVLDNWCSAKFVKVK